MIALVISLSEGVRVPCGCTFGNTLPESNNFYNIVLTIESFTQPHGALA